MNLSRRAPLATVALFAGLLGAPLATSCDSSSPAPADHKVYFVGYVYNGASGARLSAAELTAISIKYRDTVIATKIEEDGRFVTQAPLPTWQDYAVYIGAEGYRPFVSRNLGIDVPASIAMTNAVATSGTTQTFQIEARLFPLDVQASKLTITIDKADAFTTAPTPAPAAGTVRLRPVSSSLLEPSEFSSGTTARIRRWPNDEDLLAQIITTEFTNGRVELAAGTLSYGVTYELAVYDVPGYQPLIVSSSSSEDYIVGGRVTSRAVVIQKDAQARLRILSTNMDTCMPPAATSTAYGGQVDIKFSEPIEFVGSTAPEAIDNSMFITVVPMTGSISTCQLRTTASQDPTMQERGSRAAIYSDILSLSFNPAVAFMATATTGSCMLPATITSITYGSLSNVMVRPVGDDSRKKSIYLLLQEAAFAAGMSSSNLTVVCGPRPTSTF